MKALLQCLALHTTPDIAQPQQQCHYAREWGWQGPGQPVQTCLAYAESCVRLPLLGLFWQSGGGLGEWHDSAEGEVSKEACCMFQPWSSTAGKERSAPPTLGI